MDNTNERIGTGIKRSDEKYIHQALRDGCGI
jgi:hypothetical protein